MSIIGLNSRVRTTAITYQEDSDSHYSSKSELGLSTDENDNDSAESDLDSSTSEDNKDISSDLENSGISDSDSGSGEELQEASDSESMVSLFAQLCAENQNWQVEDAPEELDFLALDKGEVMLAQLKGNTQPADLFMVCTAYKPVHRKIRTVPAIYPEHARTI
jgi:hypothetical protein